MARACISAGMRCTCLKLRDLVSACESSSSSGSPSGPPASSSPAPTPRTADHVHLAHCTGDRICQGLNAMSATAAPAVGKAASFLQNGGAVTGAGSVAGDPRMWLNERRRAGRSASSHGPQRRSPPLLGAAAPQARPRAPPPAGPLPLRAPWLGSGVRSRLEQPRPPRSRAPGAAPSDRTTGAARGGHRLERASPAELVAPGLAWAGAARPRSPSPRGPAPAARCASPTSVSERVRAAAPFLFPFYLFFLPLRLDGMADAGPHRS
ncbi:hypothetical protein NN561_015969 [Cricetulus griseus]